MHETQPNDHIRSVCAGATLLEELYTLMVTSLANVLPLLGQVQHGSCAHSYHVFSASAPIYMLLCRANYDSWCVNVMFVCQLQVNR